jgi:hypothetical protein
MKLILATALGVALLAGCGGGSPSAVPGAPMAAAPSNAMASPDHFPPVESSCGNHVRIIVAGILDCRFTQDGNHGGTVNIDTSHLMGIATVTPTSGTTKTDFEVIGVLSGQGYFIVETQTRKMRVVVSVSL